MDNESMPMPESTQDGDKKTLSLNFLNESELTLDPNTALTEEDILRHFQLNQEDELEGITVSGKSKISIKNPKLVVSNVKKSYGNELTIKRRSTSKNKKDTKLSSVLNKLPNGIVYKDETGMGATTLELKTPRHSIIVEPIKITASSKAANKEYNALYVGSKTKYHPKDYVSKDQIKSYLYDNSIKYKKIVVVADSLHKVISVINEITDKKHFFLLIDEIDSFQLDSTYRLKMEECIAYYLQFKPNSRAMLTATRMNFSDPKLINEPITFIKYDQEKRRKLNIIYSTDEKIQEVATYKLIELLKQYPKDKFFVAFNSVSTSYDIIEHLVKTQIIQKNEAAILCSYASKSKVKDYYFELDSDKLPKRLNFFTSAYFTGFDLKDDYHLVSISGSNNKVYTLSDRRLKQIAGRCRNTLLSETIIHDSLRKKVKEYQKEDLIDAAHGYIQSLSCLKKHFSKYPILADYYDVFTDKLSGILQDDFGIKFTKNNSTSKEKEISYLNIDAFLEAQRVQINLYSNIHSLQKVLSEKNDVTFSISNTKTTVDKNKISLEERNELTNTVLDILKQHNTSEDILMDAGQRNLTKYQEKIISEYLNLMEYYQKDQLIKFFTKTLIDKSDLRAFNNFIFSANFLTLPESSLLVSRFKFYFQAKTIIPKSEVSTRLNYYFRDCQLPIERNTQVKAVRFVKCICSAYNTSKEDNTILKIKNYNRNKLKVLKTRKSFEDDFNVLNIMKLFS